MYVKNTVASKNSISASDNWTNLEEMCKKTRINARDSVWIFGRILKMYDCFECVSEEEETGEYPNFSPDEWLINVEEYRLAHCGFPGDEVGATTFEVIKTIAGFMISIIASDISPYVQRYLALLRDFARIGRASFISARDELYRLTKGLWGTFYYPVAYRDHDGKLVRKLVKDE